MIDKKKVINIIEDYYRDSDKFLVDIYITPQNKVMIFVDGDKGITISDCALLSKHIESFFDRDKVDFELEVSSSGIGKPLKVLRQYHKNVGRIITVTTFEKEIINGKLINVYDNKIEIEPFSQKLKDKNKKTEIIKNRFVNFDEIKEAKIKPAF